MPLKSIVNAGLKRLGLQMNRYSEPMSVETRIFNALVDFRQSRLDDGQREFIESCIKRLGQSHAQLFQDIFVLHALNDKRDGYFVEFGATNGVSLSNTLLLEQSFGWTGIVAEPAAKWQDALKLNRSCAIDGRCVWSKSKEALRFREAPEAEFSSLAITSDRDRNAPTRRDSTEYLVQTVSLSDLLNEHEAPCTIDYLSIDVEGAELDILQAYDFSRQFRVITVEHNFSAQRDPIHRLLTSKGYKRIFDSLSAWDDWYIKN